MTRSPAPLPHSIPPFLAPTREGEVLSQLPAGVLSQIGGPICIEGVDVRPALAKLTESIESFRNEIATKAVEQIERVLSKSTLRHYDVGACCALVICSCKQSLNHLTLPETNDHALSRGIQAYREMLAHRLKDIDMRCRRAIDLSKEQWPTELRGIQSELLAISKAEPTQVYELITMMVEHQSASPLPSLHSHVSALRDNPAAP